MSLSALSAALQARLAEYEHIRSISSSDPDYDRAYNVALDMVMDDLRALILDQSHSEQMGFPLFRHTLTQH